MASNNFMRILNRENPGGGYALADMIHRRKTLVYLNDDGSYEGGESPLFLAINWNASESVLNTLISYYSDDINKLNNGITPLILAAKNNNETAVKILLSNGADVNKAGDGEQTPLSVAKNQNIIDILQKKKNELTGGKKRRRKTNKNQKTSKRRKTGQKRR
jgi:ankyrin repeat protein